MQLPGDEVKVEVENASEHAHLEVSTTAGETPLAHKLASLKVEQAILQEIATSFTTSNQEANSSRCTEVQQDSQKGLPENQDQTTNTQEAPIPSKSEETDNKPEAVH